ncbi:MAG TPA: biotin-dependent carboxyltransferase family protein [Chitinophagaceae bacterium]|nr:biotin-dependent carboxyltransferase family protein [Chitinophagaceae bacterium]
MSVTIVKTGIYCSVQDQGRRGYQRYGVPVSGAMDKHAAAVANLLCGNTYDLAVLEFVLHGASIQFDDDTLIAFAGSGAIPVVISPSLQPGSLQGPALGGSLVGGTGNTTALPVHKCIFVPKNTIVELQYSDKGCMMYMAIAGGIDVPMVMGSRSMYAPVGAGGKQVAGGRLQVAEMTEVSRNIIKNMVGDKVVVSTWGAIELIEEVETDCVRVMRGHEWEQFNRVSQNKWLNDRFTISNASDRMGVKLEGGGLQVAGGRLQAAGYEMISTAVTMGTVQVIPDGSPLILMADAQTTGGYPRIAQVIDADLPILAQKRPGDKIRFREVSPLVAEELYVNRQEELIRLKRNIRTKFSI